MSNSLQSPVMMFVVLEIFLFLWYFVTLPGSVMPPNNPSIPKPSLRTALLKFLTYQFPLYLAIAYFIFKDKKSLCESLNEISRLIISKCEVLE